jgi:hypothetical protein
MNALNRRSRLLTATCFLILPSALHGAVWAQGSAPSSSPTVGQASGVTPPCAPNGDRVCGRVATQSQIDAESIVVNLEGGYRGSPARHLSGDGFAISLDGQPLTMTPRGPDDETRIADLELGAAKLALQIDPLVVTPMLNLVVLSEGITPGDTVVFDTYTNYPSFIARAEIRIVKIEAGKSQGRPVAALPVEAGQTLAWRADGQVDDVYQAVLRVYDKKGRYDETAARSLKLVQAPPAKAPGHIPAPADVLAENTLVTRNIAVRGGAVTLRASQVPQDAKLIFDGRAVRVDARGTGYLQLIMPSGSYAPVAELHVANHPVIRIARPIIIPARDRFSFAVADITWGRRELKGPVDAYLGPETRADRDILDGRLALYHSQILANGVQVTVAADTRERPLEELFTGFFDRDARGLLRRLDPTLSWPVFGDDSVTVDDAPTSGRFYLRAARDTSHILWGDYQTRLSGMDLTDYARALYGAELVTRTQGVTSFGEARAALSAFAADPGTLGAREEFRGTGGSVYYLRRQDVAQGSERLFVEVRDRNSGLVKKRRELLPARDYDLNAIQGRVFLRAPLASVEADTGFVRDGSLAGDPVYLVATYEYVPGLISPDTYTGGGRGTYWLGDHVRLGVTGYRQGGEGTDQTLFGGDIMVRWTDKSYVHFELAQSEGGGSLTSRSGTGGFDFSNQRAPDRRANAGRIEATLDLKDLNQRADGKISGYWQTRQLGFAGPGQLADLEALDNFGVQGDVNLTDFTILRVKGDARLGDITNVKSLEAGIEHRFASGIFASFGTKTDERGAVMATNSPLLNQTGSRTDAALTIGYRPMDRRDGEKPKRAWNIYGFGQSTLSLSGSRVSNDRYGIGGSVQVSPRTSLSAEISDGDLDLGAKLGLDFNANERQSLYFSYQLAAENPDAFDTGRLGQVSTGMKVRFNDHVGVFGEGRYLHGSGPTGLTQTYGINLSPNKKWSYQFSFETGTLSDPVSGDIERQAISAGLGFTTDTSRITGLIELREDTSAQSGSRQVWAWRASASRQWSPGLRTYAKVNAATSDDTNDLALTADFTEFVLAAAFRPVAHDRFNLLAKYTFLSDQASPVQLDARGGSAGINYAQRSNILALDGTYELTGTVTVGGKLAHRVGEIRLARTGHQPWFNSNATFLAARADFNVVNQWDGVIEARSLFAEQAQSTQSGFLIALHRHLSDELRLGIGYNFTDFSEDLTDQSGTARGFFINLVGAF